MKVVLKNHSIFIHDNAHMDYIVQCLVFRLSV